MRSTRRAPKRSRAEWFADFSRRRAEGFTGHAIARRYGVGHAFVYAVLSDPDGAKDKQRKRSYGLKCLGCGKTTDGSNGRDAAPRFCDACVRQRRHPPHGTRSRYESGCRCPACKRATAEHQRDYMFRTGRTARRYRNGYTPLTGKCRGCGVPYDEQTPQCKHCYTRHRQRRKSAA